MIVDFTSIEWQNLVQRHSSLRSLWSAVIRTSNSLRVRHVTVCTFSAWSPRSLAPFADVTIRVFGKSACVRCVVHLNFGQIKELDDDVPEEKLFQRMKILRPSSIRIIPSNFLTNLATDLLKSVSSPNHNVSTSEIQSSRQLNRNCWYHSMNQEQQ